MNIPIGNALQKVFSRGDLVSFSMFKHKDRQYGLITKIYTTPIANDKVRTIVWATIRTARGGEEQIPLINLKMERKLIN